MGITREHYDKLQSGIKSLLEEVSQFVNANGNYPQRKSVASGEIEVGEYSEEVQTVCSQGCLLVESAGDHAFAVSRLLEPPLLTVAPWTSVRGALEAAAYGCWLMDPDIEVRDRIARSLAFRFGGLLHQKKAADSMGDEHGVRHAKERIQEIQADTRRLGFEEKIDKKGRVVGVATTLPSSTACIRDNLFNESGYRILSSIAHSHPSAMISVSFKAKNESEPSLLSKNLSVESACWLLMTAADAFSAIAWRQASYFGYDLEEFRHSLDEIYDGMGIKKERRFWQITS